MNSTNDPLRKNASKSQKLDYLIHCLLSDKYISNQISPNIHIPKDEDSKFEILRALTSIRPPYPISKNFITVQNDLLQQINLEKGIYDFSNFEPSKKYQNIFLFKGDITSLKIDAIVNAANSGMTGCYSPYHKCIDNCIHCFAGIELRLYCNDIMQKQGHEEDTGDAKITPGFNLPAKFVIHTVGPIVETGVLNEKHKFLLKSCYESCLNCCLKNDVHSIAFCCISTGLFMFPKKDAAIIAVKTTLDFLDKNRNYDLKVVFNVFEQEDYELYKSILF